jgi:hypothetical protein
MYFCRQVKQQGKLVFTNKLQDRLNSGYIIQCQKIRTTHLGQYLLISLRGYPGDIKINKKYNILNALSHSLHGSHISFRTKDPHCA